MSGLSIAGFLAAGSSESAVGGSDDSENTEIIYSKDDVFDSFHTHIFAHLIANALFKMFNYSQIPSFVRGD